MDNLTAKIRISGKPSEMGGKFNPNHRKERHFYKELAAYTVGGRALFIARFYGTSSRTYCVIWVNVPSFAPCLRHSGEPLQNGFHLSGSGVAGGYGYCRASQALADAIFNAGIEMSANIGGRGLDSGREAISAICQEMGFKPIPPFTTGAGEVVATVDIVTAPYFFITQSNA